MPRNVWSNVASWLIRQLNNSTKSQLHALITIKSKKKNWDLLENSYKRAPKLSWNVCTWQAVVETRLSMVCKQTCTSSHKMDQSSWQTLGSLDLVHSSYKWIKAILSCGKYSTSMQTGTVSGLWLCKRSWRLKIEFGWNLCIFGSVRNKLQNHTAPQKVKLFLLMQDYAWMEFPLSISGISLLKYCFLPPTKHWHPKRKCGETCSAKNHRAKHTNTQIKTHTHHNVLELSDVEYVSCYVKSSRSGALLDIFEHNEAVIKMIIKGRSPTMRHVSRTHRIALDWFFDRIN